MTKPRSAYREFPNVSRYLEEKLFRKRVEPERLLLVTKRVYPEVARLCGTRGSAVERNIRTVCGIAWKNNRRLLEQMAHKPLLQKPNNSQFLAILLYSLPRADFLT